MNRRRGFISAVEHKEEKKMHRSNASVAQVANLPIAGAFLQSVRELERRFRLRLSLEIKFTCFSDLPVELRLKIWRSAFPPSQRVEIMNPLKAPNHPDDEPNAFKGGKPITLQINHESRTETLLHYNTIWKPEPSQGISPLVVLNPKRDIVDISISFTWREESEIMEWLTLLDSSIKGGLKAIRHLEIQHFGFRTYAKGIAQEDALLKTFLKMFTGLDKLILVLFWMSPGEIDTIPAIKERLMKVLLENVVAKSDGKNADICVITQEEHWLFNNRSI